jgi:thiamine biosynthesis lipoprotein
VDQFFVMNLSLSLQAMATRFELVLSGEDGRALRAAGEEALQEIERIEGQLSFYRADSEIATLNRLGGTQPVRLSPPTFGILAQCHQFSEATDGAFDVTIGPLMRAWHFVRENGAIPSLEELAEARSLTGVSHLIFDPERFTVAFDRPGVSVDLGGFGKGYAVERAIAILHEYGVKSAFLHGGTSSVAVIGAPPVGDEWWVELQEPFRDATGGVLRVGLVDRALSVSALNGKSFRVGDREYGHIIDPATGEPVTAAIAAAVTGPSAAVCEVLSTALMVRGPAWLATGQARFPGYRLLLTHQREDGAIVTSEALTVR